MKRSLSTFSSLLVAALSLLLIGAGGCAGLAAGQADDSKVLTGKTWRAVQIAGVATVQTAKGNAATATFADGRAGGSGSVNSWGAAYSTGPGNAIRIIDLVTTEMAGPPDLMNQEASYYIALPKTATYQVAGDSLTLFDEEGGVLVKYEAVPPAPLIGTVWQTQSFGAAPDQAVSSDDPVITATFAADGTLAGKAPVNRYSAQYAVTPEGKMTIGPQITSTKMAGSDEAMAKEAAYLAALPETASYTIDGDQLTLFDASGTTLVQFSAQ